MAFIEGKIDGIPTVVGRVMRQYGRRSARERTAGFSSVQGHGRSVLLKDGRTDHVTSLLEVCAMSIRWLFWLFALGGCFLLAIADRQAVAEENTDPHQFSPTTPSPGGQTPDVAHVVARLIDLTNEFRQAEGHQTVTANPQLTATARDFVQFMAQTDKYGHTADGNTPAA